MSAHGHLQRHYVPVALAHTAPAQSGSGNLDKWRAFGLDAGVIRGQTSADAPTPSEAARSDTHLHHVVVDAEEGAEKEKNEKEREFASAVHRQLLALSSRVREAKEERSCAAPRRDVRGDHNQRGSSSSGGGGGAVPGKRSRESGGNTEEREQQQQQPSKRVAAGSGSRSAANRSEEEQQQQQTPKKKKKQGARKAPTSAASKRAVEEPLRRTLFSMPADPAPESFHAALVAFKEVDDACPLFEDLQDALNDPHRIQAPTLFVAFATQEGETNFSISASTHGKVHFVRGVNPELAHLKVQSFVIRWNDDVFVFPAATGLKLLVRVLEELPGVEVVTFNAPSLLLVLLSYRQGRLSTSCISDVRLMSWMLQPTAGADAFTDYDVLLQSCQQQISLPAGFRNTDGRTLKEVISHRVYYMAPLYRSLYGQLGTQGLLPAFLKQEKRISLLCSAMKLNGFFVNLSEVEIFKARCASKMEELSVVAQQLVPSMPDFNMQNLDECRVALYEVLHLGEHLTHTAADGTTGCTLTVTKSGKLSTSEETLRLLAPHHKLPNVLIAYRKAAKLLQTYTVGMMETAVPVVGDDGEFTDRRIGATEELGGGRVKWVKLHPNFVQEGTDTGRLSCVEPNLQNLPRSKVIATDDDSIVSHEAEMASFRRCFAMPTDWTLLSVDYEQIELRVLAHLCADAALVDALTNATDIHRAIAETVFRKSPVSTEERSLAKRVVFGMLYGAGPRTLATQMGVTMEEALRVTSLFKASYPQIDRYHRRVVEQCRADGFVRTLSGRIRCLPEINDRVMGKRAYAERQAFNTVVQGSAADVMKLGMLSVERDVLQRQDGDVRLLAQIHDEIVLSLPTRKLREVVPLVSHGMTHAVSLLVPLRVTVKVGSSLGEMEEWTVDHELGIRQPA
ncbi:mitochondrial DNA polymerase I protein A [Trypanosoma grayi]|uniref:mitochondrial DNA polymerase I protein A n=1 Tax=Trypanosoma grayi TaxID=71804 RepID=UPI0004F44492|nr:mitochondrial DNA polymerase I protein A [Trypanosoma grayi]KEG10143.1 mitochondrial DNA polymerase I protein A [Trypanosoma grayi]